MKQKILLFIFLLLSTLTASAYDAFIDGIYYNFNTSAKTASVTYKDVYYNSYIDNVTIPATVTYNDAIYSVTSIGVEAFCECSLLTSVKIPNSVISIGELAFSGCFGLTSVTIPNSVISIGELAFSGCSGLTEVTIPNSVTFIGSGAFYECSGELTVNCNIPSPSSGSDGAFYNSKFCSVKIGDGVETIGNYAFNGCSDLKSVTISNGVTIIGDYAFLGCSELTSLTIPSTMKSIGNWAFADCSDLIDVYCYARKGPTASDGIFSNSGIQFATLHVPESSVNGYKTTTPWSEFGNIVALQDSDPQPGYDPEPEPEPTPEYIRGDVNLDGEIGMPDVMFLVQYILNGKFPDVDNNLEKAGVRFGFYETIPGYSVKINKINITGLGDAEFGSDIIGSTIGTTAVTRTWDRADGSFTNVYFKDANEDPEMVVEVNFTLIADDGSGETINKTSIVTSHLDNLTLWQANKKYTFIYKTYLAPLYMIEESEPIISLDSVVVEDSQDGMITR